MRVTHLSDRSGPVEVKNRQMDIRIHYTRQASQTQRNGKAIPSKVPATEGYYSPISTKMYVFSLSYQEKKSFYELITAYRLERDRLSLPIM